MKARHLLMSAGLLGAAWLALYGDKNGDSALAVPVAGSREKLPAISEAPSGKGVFRSSTLIEANPQGVPGGTEVRILALQPREELIGTTSGAYGLFSRKSWTPPPVIAKLEPPPPSAPPMPFTYLGKQIADGLMEVYLARGDEVFVVRDQTVIQNTYRVESINPPTLSLLYLPLNEIQLLSIGVTN